MALGTTLGFTLNASTATQISPSLSQRNRVIWLNTGEVPIVVAFGPNITAVASPPNGWLLQPGQEKELPNGFRAPGSISAIATQGGTAQVMIYED